MSGLSMPCASPVAASTASASQGAEMSFQSLSLDPQPPTRQQSSDSPLALPQVAPISMAEGQYIDCVVSDVHSASTFFVQPLVYEEPANRLSSVLCNFYDMFDEDELKVTPQFLMATGSQCVSKWQEDGRWYRAQYIKRESPSTIRVLFIDYGNQAMTKISDTKLLIRRFQEMPQLAIPCCDSLADKIDSKAFSQRVEGRVVVVRVDGAQQSSGLPLVTVFRVKKGEEVNVSQLLADDGKTD